MEVDRREAGNNYALAAGVFILGGGLYYYYTHKEKDPTLLSKEDLIAIALDKRDRGELLSDEEQKLLQDNAEIIKNLIASKPITRFDADKLKGIKVIDGTLAYHGLIPMNASIVKVISDSRTYSTVEAADVNELNKQIAEHKISSAFVGGSDLFVRTAGNIININYCRLQKVADFKGGLAAIGDSIYYEFNDPHVADQITILSNKPLMISYVMEIDGLRVLAAGETVGEDKDLFGFSVHTSIGKGIVLSDTLQEIRVKAGKKYKFFGPTKYRITKRVRFKSQVVDALMVGFIITLTLENHVIQGGTFNA